MLAHYIEQASIVENLVRVVPMENQKILINEMIVQPDGPAVDKRIVDLELPESTIISCIIRETEVMVPNGQSRIMAGDRLVVMTVPANQQEAVRAIAGNE